MEYHFVRMLTTNQTINLLTKIPDLPSKDVRFAALCQSPRQKARELSLTYVPPLFYTSIGGFGTKTVNSLFEIEFFPLEEKQLGVVHITSSVCDCTTKSFYIPVGLMQYLIEHQDELWQLYDKIIDQQMSLRHQMNRRNISETIEISNWLTGTVLEIEFSTLSNGPLQVVPDINLTLSYMNHTHSQVDSGYFTVHAVGFLDYLIFYSRYIKLNLDTSNYFIRENT